MQLNKLAQPYEHERKEKPETLNQLLDYYQRMYIFGEIDIAYYRKIYFYLHRKGAISAHEHN